MVQRPFEVYIFLKPIRKLLWLVCAPAELQSLQQKVTLPKLAKKENLIWFKYFFFTV
jgi:hypothetical protein